MRTRKLPIWPTILVLVIAGALFAGSAQAGNWAVVTLEELPESVMAGRPFTLHFTVRQHGVRPLGGLSPAVTAVHASTGERVRSKAAETSITGMYAATLTLPSSGQWHWSIDAFTATYSMPPLTVQAAKVASAAVADETSDKPWPLAAGIGGGLAALGAALAWRRPGRWRLAVLGAALSITLAGLVWIGQRPSSLAAQVDEPAVSAPGSVFAAPGIDQGEALFVAKGCIQCHQNRNVTMADNLFSIGPDLTEYQASSEFLRMWLADPSSIRPGTQMPNLNLKEEEIETLIEFLGFGAQTSRNYGSIDITSQMVLAGSSGL